MIHDEITPGMEVWIKSSVSGKASRCIVTEGNDEQGYRLRRLYGRCYAVRYRMSRAEMYLTKSDAEMETNGGFWKARLYDDAGN